ncbi:MAG: plasmid pRiA4b ORF-3 family protein [Chloroflexota bacterium]|nr:plasmid pRiA4b ORF-3 family protein [Chloroflexota bacterium]
MAKPKAWKPTKAALNRLARLPRQPDLVLEGGKRPLGIYIREGGETVRPQIALWVDARTSFIRATEVINPLESADDGIGETLRALVAALGGPFAPTLPFPAAQPPAGREGEVAPLQLPQPGLPSGIRVNDAALAEAADAIFAPLDVPVEHAADLPAFDEAFRSLSAALGADEDAPPPEPFAWEIDPTLLPPLYRAAVAYGRRAPWRFLLDHPPLAVGLGEHGPQPGLATLYACVMGAGGMVEGVAFYYSLDDVREAMTRGEAIAEDDEILDEAVDLLRQAGAPVDQVPPHLLRGLVAGFDPELELGLEPGDDEVGQENALVLFYSDEEESDPTYLEWLAERGLTYTASVGVPWFLRTAPGEEPRQPDVREVAALTLALEAVNGFLTRHGRGLAGTVPEEELTAVIRVESAAGTVPVEVRYPPAEYLEDEVLAGLDAPGEADETDEPPEPASPAGPTTLYRFQVKLDWKKSVWRRIELRGDQTLHDLHNAIQEAFDWDNDHLYAFFLSGRAWDRESEYGSPFGEGRSAARFRLEGLPLRPGQQFLYIFDFGDELRHQVKLEAVVPGGVQAGAEYPRITESRGASVPQY